MVVEPHEPMVEVVEPQKPMMTVEPHQPMVVEPHEHMLVSDPNRPHEADEIPQPHTAGGPPWTRNTVRTPFSPWRPPGSA